MNGEPGVSVVIPTFNNAATLAKAVRSALEQDWPLLELIVVDDGSTDATPQLLEAMAADDQRLRRLSQSNQGAAAARNAGVRAASYDFVAFLDADDAWSPAKLRAQMSEFAHFPNTTLCFSGYSQHGDGSRRDVLLTAWDPAHNSVLEALLEGCCVTTSTVVARRDSLVDVGLFDTTLRCCEDHDLWFRLAVAGGCFSYLGLAYTHRTIRASSLSADESEVARCSDLVYERLFATGDLPRDIQERSRVYLARCYLNSACRHLEQNDGPSALRSLWKATRTRPGSIRPGWLRLAATAAFSSVRARRAVA